MGEATTQLSGGKMSSVGEEIPYLGETEDERYQRLGTKKVLPEECRIHLKDNWEFEDLEKALLQIKNAFLKHGVIVLENFLTEAQVARFTEIFHSWYEDTSVRDPEFVAQHFPRAEGESFSDYVKRIRPYFGYEFGDSSTHKESRLTALHGILKNYGIGQAECMWWLRTQPQVLWLFMLLHGTDELFTSFDGLCFQNHKGHFGNRNPLETPKPKEGWIHQDLDPQLGRLAAFGHYFGIQVQFTFTDGHHLRAVPGAYAKDLTGCATGTTNGSTHWFKPMVEGSAKERPKYFRNKDSVVVDAPAGSAILWFSSTPHAGTNLDDERLTAYVCMFPKTHLLKDASKKRKGVAKSSFPAGVTKRVEKALRECRTTNHWGNKLNSENPQHYGDPLLDAGNLLPRLPGNQIWLRDYATEQERKTYEILTLQSSEGLLGGFEAEPIIPTHSLNEGKDLIARYASKFSS